MNEKSQLNQASNASQIGQVSQLEDPTHIIETSHIGALDIGSNSFHFVFARIVNNNLQILHSEKYRVKLAQGLDSNFVLDQATIDRGIATLAELSELTQQLTPDNFRVVATYTLRQAVNANQFLTAAAKVFPFDIEIISGHEEARLIYQGAAHYLPPDIQRLVIDIGGGSTECVIGINLETKRLTSLNIGCVSFESLYFADGTISAVAFNRAILHAKQEIESHVKRFKTAGWQEVIGTSGTLKCIYNQLNQIRGHEQAFTLEELYQFRQILIDFGDVEHINLPNLKETRRNIIAPGLAILIGVAEMLGAGPITYCDYSLREGVLCEQLDAKQFKDVRERTINSLATRFNIDLQQVDNVWQTAENLYQSAKSTWEIDKKIYHQLLFWAVNLHEIGFDINPSAYHKHGHYILSNADLPGFTLEQQTAIAWLVGNQRKKIQFNEQLQCYTLKQSALNKLLVIIRLAIILNQQRQLTEQIAAEFNVTTQMAVLLFDSGWLAEKPLFEADLLQEHKQLTQLGIDLSFG
ncbi:Ppx/GppA phosphatase family protein [Colwellia sp. MEBiC06753]